MAGSWVDPIWTPANAMLVRSLEKAKEGEKLKGVEEVEEIEKGQQIRKVTEATKEERSSFDVVAFQKQNHLETNP